MFEEDISTKAPRSIGAPLEVLLQRLYVIKEKNETWLSIAVRKHKENLEKCLLIWSSRFKSYIKT